MADITREDFHRIDKKLEALEGRLGGIERALNEIAVQDQRIGVVERQIAQMWGKWDSLLNPNDGALPKIQNWQASCPRASVKALWMVVIPLLVTMLLSNAAIAVQIAKLAGG